MENLTNAPGLQHVAEEIFLNLKSADLEKCIHVNESWRSIIMKPSFWFRKCAQVEEFLENHKNAIAWAKTFKMTNQTIFEENLTHHLKDICRDLENTNLIQQHQYIPMRSEIYWIRKKLNLKRLLIALNN